MRSTRAYCKLIMWQCKRDKSRYAGDSLAQKLLNKDKVFWKDVKQLNGNSTSISAVTVSGISGAEAICDMLAKTLTWAAQFH